MSIICPSCGASLHQITNSHIRSKHPEFKSVTEFKEFFKLDTLWSVEVKSSFIHTMTGKTRDPYNLTEKYYEGVKQGAKKRTGKQHWNYGNHWNDSVKNKISSGVRNSEVFRLAMAKWEDPDYRAQRMHIIYSKVIPNALQTRADRGLITSFENKSEWEQYRTLVNRYTRKSLKEYAHLIDPLGLLNQLDYDLDHRFSKFEGFNQNIPPEIIGSPCNLIPLLTYENRWIKRTSCSLTINELLLAFSEFITNNKSSESFKSRKS
jgi:hypothetical protein